MSEFIIIDYLKIKFRPLSNANLDISIYFVLIIKHNHYKYLNINITTKIYFLFELRFYFNLKIN